jgi:LEA14-like dessication related protein
MSRTTVLVSHGSFGVHSMICRLWPLFLYTFVLSGCAGFGQRLDSPRISLSNLTMQESTGFETIFALQLRILNPNDTDLDIIALDCKLEVNDKALAYGLSKAPVQVPAYGSAIVPITVYASAFDIARGIIGMQNRDEIIYQLKGKIRLDSTGWFASKVPFKSKGTVSLKELKSWIEPDQ